MGSTVQMVGGLISDRGPDAPPPNEKRLVNLVHWVEDQSRLGITDEERQWSQNIWGHETECGTLYCCAGYAGLQAGYFPTIEEDGSITFMMMSLREGMNIDHDEDSGNRYVDEIAREYLGLSKREGFALFKGDNDVADIKRVVEEILGYPVPERGSSE